MKIEPIPEQEDGEDRLVYLHRVFQQTKQQYEKPPEVIFPTAKNAVEKAVIATIRPLADGFTAFYYERGLLMIELIKAILIEQDK